MKGSRFRFRDEREPLLVRSRRAEVFVVILDADRSVSQNGQELLAGEVAVDKERGLRQLART